MWTIHVDCLMDVTTVAVAVAGAADAVVAVVAVAVVVDGCCCGGYNGCCKYGNSNSRSRGHTAQLQQ